MNSRIKFTTQDITKVWSTFGIKHFQIDYRTRRRKWSKEENRLRNSKSTLEKNLKKCKIKYLNGNEQQWLSLLNIQKRTKVLWKKLFIKLERGLKQLPSFKSYPRMTNSKNIKSSTIILSRNLENLKKRCLMKFIKVKTELSQLHEIWEEWFSTNQRVLRQQKLWKSMILRLIFMLFIKKQEKSLLISLTHFWKVILNTCKNTCLAKHLLFQSPTFSLEKSRDGSMKTKKFLTLISLCLKELLFKEVNRFSFLKWKSQKLNAESVTKVNMLREIQIIFMKIHTT